jgi:Rrf2 family nitric oxide-sensitive transcriptional repressor
MRLSLFSDYALRVMMFAALKDAPFNLSEVAEAYDISRNHLVKIVNHLAKLGYLETRRGRGGGICLALPAGEIRIGLLLRRTEGSPPLVECFDPAQNTCRIHGCCRLKGLLAGAVESFYASLDAHTLKDLISGPVAPRMSAALLS